MTNPELGFLAEALACARAQSLSMQRECACCLYSEPPHAESPFICWSHDVSMNGTSTRSSPRRNTWSRIHGPAVASIRKRNGSCSTIIPFLFTVRPAPDDEDDMPQRSPFIGTIQPADSEPKQPAALVTEGFRIKPREPVKQDTLPAVQKQDTTDFKASSPSPQPADPIEQPPLSHKRKSLNVSINELFDFSADEHSTEPRNEFDWLLVRVLRTIREVIPSYSIIFFWIDHESQQLIIETKITDSTTIVPNRKIPFGNDIVSQIAANGLPEALTEISPNAERDLLGYYGQPNGVRSFAGVPIYFNRESSPSLRSIRKRRTRSTHTPSTRSDSSPKSFRG